MLNQRARKRWERFPELVRVLERRNRWVDDSELAPQFAGYLSMGGHGEVLLVRAPWAGGEVLRGRIGITMGRRPVFLLMRRRDSIGSSDVLSRDWQILRPVCPRCGRALQHHACRWCGFNTRMDRCLGCSERDHDHGALLDRMVAVAPTRGKGEVK